MLLPPLLRTVRHLPSLSLSRHLTISAYQSLTNPSSTITRHFDFSSIFLTRSESSTTAFTPDDLLLFPSFLTPTEHDLLVSACDLKLRRSLGPAAPYEQGHFDGVIRGYRECEASHWGKDEVAVGAMLARVFELFPEGWEWLNPHILDLEAKGEILAHLDNVEYSGSVVAGLCLLSPAVMALRHKEDPECRFDVLLEPRTLYIQRDSIRYNFTHEIPGLAGQVWRGEAMEKGRRISLMIRNKKRNTPVGTMA